MEEWRVEDLSQFELEFSDLDKDHDGFVGGNDVRDAFLKQVYFHCVVVKI